MSFLRHIGAGALRGLGGVNYAFAVLWGVAVLLPRPGTWRRTVRDVLGRQILFTGVDALRFVGLVAFMAGVSVVVQAQLWVTRAAHAELLGPALVMVLVREAGPLLTNFVVIARSGTAIATELANMRVTGEVGTLDAQGIDPMLYLVVPRVLGVAVSVFCLTIAFVIVSLASGYVAAQLLQPNTSDPLLFGTNLLKAVKQADVYNVLAKTLITGLFTGAICSSEGLRIGGSITEVPQAVTRAVVRSIGALFIISAVVSLLTYM
ncbi:MAG: ABC transporter permease [Kiritimatiellae bacterium]|nr:ABC transporter permease [Kiritimatiellia bacterium]